MKDLIKKWTTALSAEKITTSYRLFQSLEKGISTAVTLKSAQAFMEHLEKNHYKKIKMISFPADGTPLPSGSCMPRAWECDSAKLAIVSPGEEKVLVDSPDQVIAFSSGTGKEGKWYSLNVNSRLHRSAILAVFSKASSQLGNS